MGIRDGAQSKGLVRNQCTSAWRQAERVGAVQPGKEKALGRPKASFHCLKGLQECCRRTWDRQGHGITEQGRMASNRHSLP